MATDGNPLAVGELRAAREDAPTVLIYGHYDVQSVGDPAAWTTPPFEPDVRDGRVYARGASDDKGNFLPLLHVACALAAAGALPVNVRVLVEGEEETGGEAVAHWVRADERGADCAIVFDSGMVDEHTPAITVGLRGLVMLHLEVRTAERDLHSGIYGGSALNALHVLHAMLGAVLPGPDGRLREELRAGVAAPAKAERESWERLPPGDEVLAAVGARPAYPGAGAEYYERNGAEPSLEINAIQRRRAAHGRARRGARERLAAPGARPARAGGPARRSSACCATRCRPGPSWSCRPSWPSPRCSRPTTRRSRWRPRRSSARSARRPRSCAPAARSRWSPSSPRATSRPWSAASAWRTTPTTRPTSPSGSWPWTRARPPRPTSSIRRSRRSERGHPRAVCAAARRLQPHRGEGVSGGLGARGSATAWCANRLDSVRKRSNPTRSPEDDRERGAVHISSPRRRQLASRMPQRDADAGASTTRGY